VTYLNEIAFIDPNVSYIETLIAGFRPEVEPVLLNATESAPRQMARAIAGRSGLSAIHVIAHGAPGEVQFAAGTLTVENIEDHEGELSAISRALGANARLLLWSCETGYGKRGAALLDALVGATNAHVAASTGRVGAAAFNGRWELDASASAISAHAPLAASGMAAYPGVLATKNLEWNHYG
jgi:hypothetical protein